MTHQLLLKSLAAFKTATKAGKSEMEETGAAEGMVEALMAMALFCDRALRAAENTENGGGTPLDIEVSGLGGFLGWEEGDEQPS